MPPLPLVLSPVAGGQPQLSNYLTSNLFYPGPSEALGWAGLGWAGLGWAGLGWAGLGN